MTDRRNTAYNSTFALSGLILRGQISEKKNSYLRIKFCLDPLKANLQNVIANGKRRQQ